MEMLENALQAVLDQNLVYVATVNKDTPDIRPMDGFVHLDGKLALCTRVGKNLYNEMKENHNVTALAIIQGKVVRISGIVTIDESLPIKQKYHVLAPTTADKYGGGIENMAVIIFDNATVEVSFKGQKEKEKLY